MTGPAPGRRVERRTIEVVTFAREVVRIRDEEANLRDVGTVKA